MNRFKKTYLSLVVLLGFLLSMGCSDTTAKKPYGVPPGLTIDASTPIDYMTVYYYSLRICLKCHVSRTGPELSTYESLRANISEVSSAVMGGEMPPSGDRYSPLDACQKLVLSTWISAGMPKEGGPTLGASGNACY